MSVTNIKYVQDIYDLAKGGSMEIAYKLQVHSRTVERWPRQGIPDKYWQQLHELYGVTPLECFKLNARIRGYRAK